MSPKAKIDPDFDPADNDNDNDDFEEEERKAKRRRWDQDDDEDEDAKEARREKENELRKQIRRIAEQMAQSKGGTVDEWIFLLTPRGRPFSDAHVLAMGYKFVAPFNYTNKSGFVLFQSRRYEHKDNKKEKLFLLRQPACLDDKGSHRDANNIRHWANGKPFAVIYRWHEIAARPGERVIVCEGEGNADRVAKLGLLATTVAGQKWSENAAEMLADRELVVLEDNDESGRHNAEKAIEVLTPVAKSIRVVRLPGLKHRNDVVDWLDAGHTKEEFEAIVEGTEPEGLTTEIDLTVLDCGPLPPQQWVVDERVPLEVAGLISGHGGTGKSTIMLQGSVACAMGQPWLGLSVRQGPTLYVDAEDPKLAILHRINAIRHYYGSISGDELKRLGLHVHSLRGKNAVLGEIGRNGRIAPTENYHRLIEMVTAIKPVLITIANSANTFAGSEIDRAQVQQFMDMLTHVGMIAGGTVVLIAHSSLIGLQSKTGLSGSTQWHNASRARMTLSGTKKDEEEPTSDLRMLEFQKNNYGPDATSLAVRYKNGVFVPVAGVTVTTAERNQQVEDLYLDLLMELTIRQDLASSRQATNYAAKLIYNHPRGKEFIGQEEVEEAQVRLLAAGKIHIGTSRSGPPSRRFQVILPGEGPL